jgi:hypothetical protein
MNQKDIKLLLFNYYYLLLYHIHDDELLSMTNISNYNKKNCKKFIDTRITCIKKVKNTTPACNIDNLFS